MGLLARVALFPLAGPFHSRWPRYNVVDVRESVRAFGPDVVALEPLGPGALERQDWQDTSEVALPHTVVPWARVANVPAVEVGLAPSDPQDPGDVGAEEDLKRYLELYEDGMKRLRRVEAAWGPVSQLLAQPLDAFRVRTELVEAVAAQQAVQTEQLGAGPGDGWRDARAELVVSRSLAAARSVAPPGGESDTVRMAVLAGVESVPALTRVLTGRAAAASGVTVELVDPPLPVVSEESRVRALLDAAMSGRGEPERLLRNLAGIDAPEARYHEANVLLENGHPAEALEKLEALVNGDFSRPYYLPGFALARLGQLRDLADRREDAMRSYRGVMALSYAPSPARAAAEAGLAAPFTLQEA